METAIPEGFKEMVRGMQGIDGEALLAALDTPSPVSIKINRRKLKDCSTQAVAGTLGYGDLKPVPWCASGFYLPARPQFTLNPLLHAGVFYVQEAGSMFYESIVQELAADLPPGLVLDACAAPGGKSTSILNALPDGWTLVSNEFVPTRAAVLRENLLKWGYPDIVVTNSPVSALAKGAPLFSIVAVDAPCSGEGMMRKEPVARSQWSPGLVQQCAALQREILADAVGALLPGGILIYSTCTFNTAEADATFSGWSTTSVSSRFSCDAPHSYRARPTIHPPTMPCGSCRTSPTARACSWPRSANRANSGPSEILRRNSPNC